MQDARTMPVPPEDHDAESVQARTLIRAGEIVGGISALANFLKVSRADLMGWMQGASSPPKGIFLKSVDVVLGHDRMSEKTAQAGVRLDSTRDDKSKLA